MYLIRYLSKNKNHNIILNDDNNMYYSTDDDGEIIYSPSNEIDYKWILDEHEIDEPWTFKSRDGDSVHMIYHKYPHVEEGNNPYHTGLIAFEKKCAKAITEGTEKYGSHFVTNILRPGRRA